MKRVENIGANKALTIERKPDNI